MPGMTLDVQDCSSKYFYSADIIITKQKRGKKNWKCYFSLELLHLSRAGHAENLISCFTPWLGVTLGILSGLLSPSVAFYK